MRLLRTLDLILEEYHGYDLPRYAVLSHVWEGDEVSFKDVKDGILSKPLGRTQLNRKSVEKVLGLCLIARSRYNLDYVWIDTCCIDKTSSTELSEAINSMYDWYTKAWVCVVYLADFQLSHKCSGTGCTYEWQQELLDQDHTQFVRCRWHTRGFTLQELLAPKEVNFFDQTWHYFGNRKMLGFSIERVTGIPPGAVKDPDSYSVAQKMSWASLRETTRPEDQAYCLLGLFNVNMPLLYGEGAQRAFFRLQQQIIQTSTDETIFAWDNDYENLDKLDTNGMLAPSPRFFRGCHDVEVFDYFQRQPYHLTTRGLQIEVILVKNRNEYDSGLECLALLNCSRRRRLLAVQLKRGDSDDPRQIKDYVHDGSLLSRINLGAITKDEFPNLQPSNLCLGTVEQRSLQRSRRVAKEWADRIMLQFDHSPFRVLSTKDFLSLTGEQTSAYLDECWR